jgi:ribosomal protein L35AE/L33A
MPHPVARGVTALLSIWKRTVRPTPAPTKITGVEVTSSADSVIAKRVFLLENDSGRSRDLRCQYAAVHGKFESNIRE